MRACKWYLMVVNPYKDRAGAGIERHTSLRKVPLSTVKVLITALL